MTKKAVIVNIAVQHALGNRASGIIPSRKTIFKILDASGARRGFLSVNFITDAAIKKLNRVFLKKDRWTDVLAFDYAPGAPKGLIAGDACISLDAARRVSKEMGVALKEEVLRYVVHAILHLTGYDDMTPVKKKKMWEKQEALVRKMTGSKVSTSQRFRKRR